MHNLALISLIRGILSMSKDIGVIELQYRKAINEISDMIYKNSDKSLEIQNS